jgi:hypothetical protein
MYSFAGQRISGGPNDGFNYLTSATNSALFNWTILDELNNEGEFYSMQCGNYNSQTGTGFISGAQLKTNTIRHESGDLESHYAKYVAAQNQTNNNVGVGLEQTTADPSVSLQTFLSSTVQNAVASRISAIDSATAVEPCGVNYLYNGACVYQGAVNYPPYQSCN